MNLKVIQKGFNYSQDGPGNRLVFHLQGCNMKCPWCANPESILLDGILMIDKEKLLDVVCPNGAIYNKKLNRDICKNCKDKVCIKQNKNEGIRWSCHTYSIEQIVEDVKNAKSLFFNSGGVTFSGGEPTLQFDSLKEVLYKLKNQNINTAIETNGTHPRLEELFPFVDHLIMDLKHIEGDVQKKYTGMGNKQTKQNISKAIKYHPNILIRMPLINGFNANVKDIPNYLSFWKGFSCNNVRFEFLRYHEFGKAKWEQCNFDYKMQDGFVEEEIREAFEKEYIKTGLQIVRT